MKKLLLVGLLVVLSSFAYAQTPDNWANISFIGQYAPERSQGTAYDIGFDMADYTFLPSTNLGVFGRMAIGWELGSSDCVRLMVDCGPVYTTVVAGGVSAYCGLGMALATADTKSENETQVGMCADMGCRFRLTAEGTGDLAFVVGAVANLYFLHMYKETRVDGITWDVMGYTGFSLGYDFGRRSIYEPVYYY